MSWEDESGIGKLKIIINAPLTIARLYFLGIPFFWLTFAVMQTQPITLWGAFLIFLLGLLWPAVVPCMLGTSFQMTLFSH